MKIVSAPPSALHSRVEGIFASESLHGRWKLFAHSRRVDPASSSAATATVSETVSPGTGGAAAGGDGVAVANVAATAIASGDDGAELADEVGANGSATANAADMDVSAARVAVDGHVKTGGGGEGGGGEGGGGGGDGAASDGQNAKPTEEGRQVHASSKAVAGAAKIKKKRRTLGGVGAAGGAHKQHANKQHASSQHADGAATADGDDGQQTKPYLFVGDLVAIKPQMLDAFGNRAAATQEGLLVITISPQGHPPEVISGPPQLMQGSWNNDATSELRYAGLHRVCATLDGEHLQGSPFEFFAKIRPSAWTPPPVAE